MRALLALGAPVLAVLAPVAIAQDAPVQSAASPKHDNPYAHLQALDARIQTIGWQLARANAAFCPDTRPGIGLLLQDAKSWRDPDAVRSALGLTGDIAVGAVAKGSPAQLAGLRANRPVLAIGGLPASKFPEAEPGDYRRLTELHDRIDRDLAERGAVRLTVGPDVRFVSIPGREICASRFELLTDGSSARADGARVLVSRTMAEEVPDDAMLAAAIAHELAHNILRHPQLRSEEGKSWGKVRHNEREADRLSAWLLVNAGYDIDGAVRFQRDWMRHQGWGFLVPTHDAWDERIAAIEQERALIDAQTANGIAPGGFDWSGRFPMSREDARP